ncbi:MAG: amino acid dehydrogenase, partial [Pontixanthobacter sp.]
SVGGGVARLLAQDGAKLTLSDINTEHAKALARELGGEFAAADTIMGISCDVFSPNALGAILDDDGIARLEAPVVAGGANNQLARQGHGEALAKRGILYAPDYVINAGGIISVAMEYLCKRDNNACDINEVRKRIAQIPGRLEEIWAMSDSSGVSSDLVADRMAQKLIGR